jgi:hypothetical protein
MADTKVFVSTNSAVVGRSYAIDTVSTLNTYRLTMGIDGLVSVYINNGAAAVISGYAGQALSVDNIDFGSLSTSVDGISKWDYLAFTNAGAFAPIPEPSITVLLGVGIFGLLAARGRGFSCRSKV